jgi:hypothetical protein
MAIYLGELRPFAFNFVPQGWLECTGALLSPENNTALLSLLGDQRWRRRPFQTFRAARSWASPMEQTRPVPPAEAKQLRSSRPTSPAPRLRQLALQPLETKATVPPRTARREQVRSCMGTRLLRPSSTPRRGGKHNVLENCPPLPIGIGNVESFVNCLDRLVRQLRLLRHPCLRTRVTEEDSASDGTPFPSRTKPPHLPRARAFHVRFDKVLLCDGRRQANTPRCFQASYVQPMLKGIKLAAGATRQAQRPEGTDTLSEVLMNRRDRVFNLGSLRRGDPRAYHGVSSRSRCFANLPTISSTLINCPVSMPGHGVSALCRSQARRLFKSSGQNGHVPHCNGLAS